MNYILLLLGAYDEFIKKVIQDVDKKISDTNKFIVT